MRILILCTGNSCRSQMAEGFLKSFNPRLEVYSAGTQPAAEANQIAVAAMKEAGIDISGNQPKNVELFLNDPFDYVITVCDNAKETCPYFNGYVKHRLHIGFDDPAEARGTFEEVMPEYHRVRDEIREGFWKLYQEKIEPEMDEEKCECDGVCCPPKKKSRWPKIVFVVVLLAAAGIIVMKLFFSPPQTPAASRQVVNDTNSPAWADTSCSKSGCDTTKSSSCCPK